MYDSIPPEILTEGTTGGVLPPVQAPILKFLAEQIGLQMNADIQAPTVTGTEAIYGYRLYRAPTPAGPWKLISFALADPIRLQTRIADAVPQYGTTVFYAATCYDGDNNESPFSNIVAYSAAMAPTTAPATVSFDSLL